MVANSIQAKVVFSYRGEDYSPTMTLDLDAIMSLHGTLPDLYASLARSNGIDTYSYLYEVMEATELCFENPRGVAAECFADGVFDIPCFERAWHAWRALDALRMVAGEELGVADLEGEPALKRALLRAYDLGRAAERPPGDAPR
ncbi:MAG: hypothetical protein C3L25_00205 [Candidatus Sedimenticola endophacoides]|uniref:Uncharacterized protein n=1 Tax=Candidatus Sedimenticola endophacoides TaxID=2548426 RepID=A0A6N4E089_9GAMM|nr:MAG: hypothetical protein C3L26_00215 [Candidatus Sedimenticola endophacoides]PUE05400.1 MAG: hypothetical protein C3L24_01250 [Candidatus Sedimenticola endophacoides]PUE05625.1 MAG: hypothetical protein C3L25_00205 [Candidatus Sedimenticola endophacoides]